MRRGPLKLPQRAAVPDDEIGAEKRGFAVTMTVLSAFLAASLLS
jgi:hypothetical protein